MILLTATPMFPLGQIVMTPGIESNVTLAGINKALNEYIRKDWGILCDEDKALNDQALKYGSRIFAKYTDFAGNDFYIITESDRSVTTILLPEEY